MKDILDKRNELCKKSCNLRSLKFDTSIKDDQVDKLIDEQDKVYKKYIFYKEFIKSVRKEKKKWNITY